jgi:hypothetical protein
MAQVKQISGIQQAVEKETYESGLIIVIRNQQLSTALGNRLGQNTLALAKVTTVPTPLRVVVLVVLVVVVTLVDAVGTDRAAPEVVDVTGVK